MSSPPPTQGSKRHRVHDAVQQNVRRVRRAFRPSPGPRSCSPLESSAAPPHTQSPSHIPPEGPSLTISTHLTQRQTPGATQLIAGSSTPSANTSQVSATVTSHTTNPGPSTLKKLKNARKTAWAGLETALRALGRSADEFPPLRSAVDSLVACLDVVQAATANHEDYDEMASELTATADTLTRCMGQLSLDDHDGSIAEIASSIAAQVTHIDEQRDRGKGKRIIESTRDKEDIVKNYRHIEQLFRRLQTEVSLRTLQDTSEHFLMTLLKRLSAVDDARYNSIYSTTIQRRACTPKTRENVQAALQSWVQDPKSAKVYWMNGMAGTGKTTIAYSLCEWLEKNNLLGASFFCSRVSSSCRAVNRIVPTVAYQLARYSPAFRSVLYKVLKDDPDAGTLNMVQQFEKLVRKPMQEVKDWMTTGVIVVIDALDECEDSYSTRLILETILQLGTGLPVKFFVSSRPDPVIREKMLTSCGHFPSVLHLHDIEQWIVESDIKKYLKEALGTLSPPPSENDVHQLAKLSGKLFIYAATVARYILPHDVPVNSRARLEAILATDSQAAGRSGSSRKYKELDWLYTTILASVFNNAALEDEELEARRLVLWTVVCAKEPMTSQALGSLLNLTEQDVLSSLSPLRSVLHVSEEGGLVSTLHASFPHFVLDPLRSGSFHCDEMKISRLLADRCFDVMKKQLRFNICHLESSFVFDSDVPDIDDRVKSFIPPALFYACRYFGEHLRLSGTSDELGDELADFLSHRLLFWMEVLNLRRCVVLGAPVLGQAHAWLMATSASSALLKQLADARNFVTRFAASACTRSTPHIYISALPFCSKRSTVYEHYWGRVRGLMNVNGTAIGRREEAELATWTTSTTVCSVAFSPNGTHIVSGSKDGTIRVLDAQTGAAIAGPFKGHTGPVWSIAFSPDGTRIVSGSSDSTIRVWDARTGAVLIGPILGHTGRVLSVACSPDGTRIVSGSWDGSILVWDAHTGTIIAGPFVGYIDTASSVVFSADGIWIVSGSCNNTIQVRDAYTGLVVAGPFQGHTDRVSSVAFSTDGTRVVSGSSDKAILVWSVPAGAVAAGPFRGHTGPISSVAFSPDNSRVVSSSWDYTIRIWDVHTSVTVARLFQHSYPVQLTPPAFSAPSEPIVMGNTIRICLAQEAWRIPTILPLQHVPLISSTRPSSNTSLGQHPGWPNASILTASRDLAPDGWITADNSLLFWVSPDLQESLPHPCESLVIGPLGSLQIDSWDLLLGDRWSECYVDQ